MSRKYDQYKIKITYHNGDIEEIKYESNINKSNYKEMLEVYRATKADYEDDKTVGMINFIGISEKGEVGIIFTKEVSKLIDDKISTQLARDCRDVMKEACNIFRILKEQNIYYGEIIGKCEKRRDTLSHQILLLDNDNLEGAELSLKEHEIITEQKEVELLRRKAKNNKTDLVSFFKKANLNNIITILEEYSQPRDLNGCDKESTKDFKDRVEKEFTYKTEKQRIHYMSQFKNKFDEVKHDAVNKTLYFYNHVGEGKKKNNRNKY
ncbi:MAG: hypothetical protein RR942_01415 [Romboutsia sp.]